MNDDQRALLDLMIDRFERLEKQSDSMFVKLEKQNDEQTNMLRTHIAKDEEFYKKIDKHETFFMAVGVVVLGFLGAIGTWFATTLGFTR